MTLAEITDIIEQAVRDKSQIANIKDAEIGGFTLLNDNPLPDIHLRFQRVKFLGNLALDQVVFPKGASFIDVDFMGITTFKFARFDGPAYFWKCRFHKKVDFFRASVLKKNYPNSRRCDGEVNFSYSEFSEEALLNRTVFTGPAYFHRTVFRRNVNFQEARFEDGITFDSTASDICVAVRELPADTVPRLLQKGLLVKSGDRKDGYYNFDTLIESSEDLHKKLSKHPERYRGRQVAFKNMHPEVKLPEELIFQEEEKKQIIDVWSHYHSLLMFNWDHHANFTGCYFGPSARFRHLSLRSCLLSGTSLASAGFDDVMWDDRSASRWSSRFSLIWPVRDKVSDELDLRERIREQTIKERFKRDSSHRIRNHRLSISTTYHELKSIYEKKGSGNAPGISTTARWRWFG